MYSNDSDILIFLKTIWREGDVRELRILTANDYKIYSGYFDNPETMAEQAAHHSNSGKAKGVYYTLNSVKPDALARAKNKTIRAKKDGTTKDHEIDRRTLLLLDFDPVRMAGISSTPEEHDAAVDRAHQCAAWLAEQGWPEPVLADSGNGGHLLYRIDLPNDGDSTALVKSVLLAVKDKLDDAAVTGDDKVFNASRISKVYGTMTRKGDDTELRPHRMAGVISTPSRLEVVPVRRESDSHTSGSSLCRSASHDTNSRYPSILRIDYVKNVALALP